MTEQRGLTYSGADVAEFLELADPSVLGLERIVRSVRQASAGVPRAHVAALQFVRWWLERTHREPAELDADVHRWWDEAAGAEDLRDLAREQAEAFRDRANDERLSSNHPDVVRVYAEEQEAVAADLEAWADRPRRDLLSELEAEDAGPEWPRRLVYEQVHGAKNARLFKRQCPHPIISSDAVAYAFRDGFWHETTDDTLAAEVRATDPTDVLDVNHVAKVVRGVHQLSETAARPFDWIEPDGTEPAPQHLALFRNGLLDVSSGELISHDGRYFATGLPDHDWDPFAECPHWMAWLDETLDPSFHPTLQEWFGYCLVPDVRAHRFAILLGGPRTGKSTAHGVLHALVGAQHAASVMMPDLGSDFGLEGLIDKRLAVVPDAHDAPARNRAAALERIKSITGADSVSVNRKNRSIVNAVLRTRLVVTCNRLPKFIDESGALAARMLIVRFERSFMGREDRSMGERLAGEMSGIANWAIHGLLRLRANGLSFTVGEAGRAEAETAARSQSPALRFAEQCLEVTGDHSDFTPMRDIQDAYRIWAADEGVQRAEIRSQNDLAQDLVAALPGLRYTQRRVDGRQAYGMAGVANAQLPDEDEAP